MAVEQLFYELIRVGIGKQACLSHTPAADEWGELYAIAKNQSLVGVCFAGVQRLQLQKQCPPEMIYLTWMGMAAKIQQRNEVVNRQCVELQAKLSADGFRSCILKGQAAASLYKDCPFHSTNSGQASSGTRGFNKFQEVSYQSDLSLLRQSGDIDIYIEGGLEKVNGYVQGIAPTNKIDVQHIQFECFEGTEVEAHYIPFVLNSPIQNRVLSVFFREQEERMLTNTITLTDGNVIVGAHNEFNLVFMLAHIYQHLFTEGIGLRQLMDYHFVIKHEMEVEKGSNVQEVKKVISKLGLNSLASALVWVLGHVFGLPEEQMLWKPNEKDGRFLLEEIILSGNFGKQDERQRGLYDSKWNSFWIVHMKTFRMWRFDHWAWLWSPIWRVKGYAWRKLKGYK